MLKAGLAALTLSGMSNAIAKEQTLKTSNGHSKPAAKKAGAKRIVMLDPGHGGIDTGAIGHSGSKRETRRSGNCQKTFALSCAVTASMPV